jgi:rhamnopyranosyl-N-acetylglucosaminyl-diphospho-decaprenol beta-1,3/1,4-galactofuranosyltransferase
LDAIFIIDGPSTDGTPEALVKNAYIKELPPANYNWYSWETKNVNYSPFNNRPITIHYVRLYEDVGGSGGFYECAKKAYEKGYDWIWLMDDDVEPKENALEELVKYINLPDVAALAPVVKEPDGSISLSHRGLISFNQIFPMMQIPLKEEVYHSESPIPIDFVSLVGPMIHSCAVKSIGLPRKDFFIHHDDAEYSIRLREAGKIYLVPTSAVVHRMKLKKDKLVKAIFLGKEFQRISYRKLWKIYYGKRNLTYLGKKYSKNKFTFRVQLIKLWVQSTLAIILFDDCKIRRIRFITSAYLDGLRSIFDNEKPKRILYGGKKK